MADFPMGRRGFAPQAGSYQAYDSYSAQPQPSQHQSYRPPESGARNGSGATVRTFAALTGAGLSLALLVGVGVWGYQLMARDVTGVPVVRAMQGEMRVRPAEPGGMQAQNQGFAVNEVAAEGGTAGPSERIVLAPEPIDLSTEETPLIDRLAAAQPRFAEPTAQVEGAALTTAAPSTETATAQTDPAQLSSIQALANQIAAGATPLTQGQIAPSTPVRTSLSEDVAAVADPVAPADPLASAPADPLASADVIAATAPGVAMSPRPKLRPEGVRTASASATTSTGARDIDPNTIASGTRLVQLGAYESPEIARREWERFSTRFGEYMEGKDRVVQRATSGGRTFFRLRAMGFDDLAAARRFCAALAAQNTDCIPVVTR
jgi:hypothetical protein